MKIKKGDNVVILVGKDRNKTGTVGKVFPQSNKLVVTGLNIYKKHLRPSRRNPHGGIIDIGIPLDVSNIMLICPRCSKKTRVGYKIIKDGKIRICQKCGEAVDEIK